MGAAVLARHVSDLSEFFNRNKRSVAARQLRGPTKTCDSRRSSSCVDAVLQNMRPGLVEELGLDGRETLRRSKLGTIDAKNCALPGASGPYKDRPGYDLLNGYRFG